MTATISVPVEMTPEAQERVAELGFQAVLRQMIEHVSQAVPQLVRITVEQFVRADEDSPPGILVTAVTTLPWEETLQGGCNLTRWKVETFPPEVCEHVVLTFGFAEAASAG